MKPLRRPDGTLRRPLPWPVLRQLVGHDSLGRGAAAESSWSRGLTSRNATADKVVKSVCPYCGVGCAQNVYVKDGRVVQIEGDPDSPISRGRLCPKGSASLQLTTGDARLHEVLYRRPHGLDWERLDLETALDMVADRMIETRRRTWQWDTDGGGSADGGDGDRDGGGGDADGGGGGGDADGGGADGGGTGAKRVRRTLGIASLGGATLDNEENYLIKKLLTSLGIVQIENQARVCHSSTVTGLGTSFGRGGATTFMEDLQNADCILIQGSNFAEAHPVGFQWVMEAKARGATVIHVDPRFTRTSAHADIVVPLRAGSDVAFLGGIINWVLQNGREFREYVVAYTNASTIVSADFVDTEDLDGLFSGFDGEGRSYDSKTWQYEGMEAQAASGDRDLQYEDRTGDGDGSSGSSSSSDGSAGTQAESTGSGGHDVGSGEPERDESLEHPRCVYQILKRHFSRYTPEKVAEVCGVPEALFLQVCEEIAANSGRDRTTAFAYAVGWTQHTIGSQMIRAASILQLLLGNIGRPGGGIQALRGHASIQGSSDIPTLYNLLPGYIPMPHAHAHEDLESFVRGESAGKGYWANMGDYTVSLLKAWWGGSASAENDFCFDYLPRVTGAHDTYSTVMAQIDGECKGYFILGENPAVGSANAKMQRLGMANLDWLVVRDFSLIESATWWKDGPEIDSGELSTKDIGTEVFFFPAAAHTEKSGSFTNTNRLLQYHFQAVEPEGEARSDMWFVYHLGRKIRERLAGSADPMDRPVLDLTWDYPTEGPLDEPVAEAILAEINGFDSEGRPLASYEQLTSDGSTACGCWIYCGVFADGVNQAARRRPASEMSWVAPEWGWSWPMNRRILYNRASADELGRPWSERKAYVWWDDTQSLWTGHDIPDFTATKSPNYRPPAGSTGPDALSGTDPFIMQSDGRGWLFAPAGLADGPMPAHYEPEDSPFSNAFYGQLHNPARETFPRKHNRYHPDPDSPGSDVFPYVATTYRLTEQFTAGGMSRWSPYLAELQPEMFCEVSPELAAERGLEHGGWATIVSARSAIEARVLVTDRMSSMTVQGKRLHQVGLPFHWGPNGYATGDAANELSAISLDPNSHIQEVKAFSVDIVRGRRPRGTALPELVRQYQERAGIAP